MTHSAFERLSRAFDLSFGYVAVAVFVLAICSIVYQFYGEKLTFELNPEKKEKSEGIKFALACGAILACAFVAFLYWLRA